MVEGNISGSGQLKKLNARTKNLEKNIKHRIREEDYANHKSFKKANVKKKSKTSIKRLMNM